MEASATSAPEASPEDLESVPRNEYPAMSEDPGVTAAIDAVQMEVLLNLDPVEASPGEIPNPDAMNVEDVQDLQVSRQFVRFVRQLSHPLGARPVAVTHEAIVLENDGDTEIDDEYPSYISCFPPDRTST